MNIPSKFGNCITTQTLNIALFVSGWNYGQTNRRADGRSDSLLHPVDLSDRGIKNPILGVCTISKKISYESQRCFPQAMTLSNSHNSPDCVTTSKHQSQTSQTRYAKFTCLLFKMEILEIKQQFCTQNVFQ